MYLLIHFAFPIFRGTEKECEQMKDRVLKTKPEEKKRMMIILEKEFDEIYEGANNDCV